MTVLSKTTFKGLFETGDVPQQTDYANLFDSCVMCAETTAQSMLGSLRIQNEMASTSVSANTGTFGNLAVSALTLSNLSITNLTAVSANVGNLQVSTVSAAALTGNTAVVSGGTFTSLQATTLNATTASAATLTAAVATITTLTAPTANVSALNASEVSATNGFIASAGHNTVKINATFTASATTVTAVPVTANSLMTARTEAGLTEFTIQPASNRNAVIQPSLSARKVYELRAYVVNVGMGISDTGTFANTSPTSTNLFTSIARGRYTSAGTTGASCGTRGTQPICWRGNAAGLGGFKYRCTFGMVTTVATQRIFMGLVSGTAAIGNVDPSSLTDMVGIGADSGDTTFQIMVNDNAGTATRTDLGANFPVSGNSTDLYELNLYAQPNGSDIGYQVKRLNTGNVASGTLSANLPTSTAFLVPHFRANNNSTASLTAFDLMGFYLETDY